MSSSVFKVFLVSILLAQHYSVGVYFQPSYQVSLYVNSNGKNVHYCNGVIVHSRLILTAASCTFYRLLPNGPVVHIKPQRISVVAGADGESFEKRNTFKVRSIECAKNFDQTTLENDLALLRLVTFVPLDTREDISWIVMDEYDPRYDAEVMHASFPSLSGTDAQMENLKIVTSEHCTARPNDICSIYPSMTAYSQALINFPQLNGDLGTGLISGSHLVGILSTAVMCSTDYCSLDEPPNALFTNLSTHFAWIYDVMASEEQMTKTENKIAFSAPYRDPESAAFRIGEVLSTCKSFITSQLSYSPESHVNQRNLVYHRSYVERCVHSIHPIYVGEEHKKLQIKVDEGN